MKEDLIAATFNKITSSQSWCTAERAHLNWSNNIKNGGHEMDRMTLDINEASDLLGVTVAALRRWIRERRAPPYFRAGRLIRFRRSDVEAWIQERIVEDEIREKRGQSR